MTKEDIETETQEALAFIMKQKGDSVTPRDWSWKIILSLQSHQLRLDRVLEVNESMINWMENTQKTLDIITRRLVALEAENDKLKGDGK